MELHDGSDDRYSVGFSMTKQELTEAYHALANEAMKVQYRVTQREEIREMFDMLWRTDYDKAKRHAVKESDELA
jgi:hypothetical protein